MATDPQWIVNADKADKLAAILDQARENYASWFLAHRDDLDPEACGQWIDQLYDGLAAALTPEDRLIAIVALLRLDAENRAAQIRRSLEVR